MKTAEEQKKAAALAALEFVKPGMRVGLGTGTTANYFTVALAEKVKAGLDIQAVPTSKATRDLALELGIPLTDLEKQTFLDLTVDGTDEFDPNFQLIKGGGGALLLEKIVASSSKHMIVICDESKRVDTLGRFPLPIEVIPFGVKATGWKIESILKKNGLKGKFSIRVRNGKPFTTDTAHIIVDCALGKIHDPERLSDMLNTVPGVVDHGLFVNICGIVLMGTKDGVKTLRKR